MASHGNGAADDTGLATLNCDRHPVLPHHLKDVADFRFAFRKRNTVCCASHLGFVFQIRMIGVSHWMNELMFQTGYPSYLLPAFIT